jgi:hypothetical protein
MPDDEADLGSPSGSASAGPRRSAGRVVEHLGEAECMELLAGGGVGRLAYNSRWGITALPVEYKIDVGSIVLRTWDLRTDEDLRTGIAHAEYQVAVEADQVHLETGEAWFVLARGRRITWIPKLSECRSSRPGSGRGSGSGNGPRGRNLGTLSG